jgi:hypothetical protein
MNHEKWSKAEKAVARRAFENACEMECREIINKLRVMVNEADEPHDIWRVHDFLREKRRETDAKYDYRYSVLTLVFARLLREGCITVDDLESLKEDKITTIRELANG